MDPTWVHSSKDELLPRSAVRIGVAKKGAVSFVGRAVIEGESLPAAIIPRKFGAFVGWRGKEYKVTKYEVLVGNGYRWQACNNDVIPESAVRSGNTICGDPLYFGRVLYGDKIFLGRIQPSEECIYFAYNGEEMRKLLSYEFLVRGTADSWVYTSFHYTPVDAVVGGRDTDGAVIYVGRARVLGMWLPAKVIPSKTCTYTCFEGKELFTQYYEILCGGQKYKWVKVKDHYIPRNAVETDTNEDGLPLYVGRGVYKKSLTPGVISLEKDCLLLPYGGREISVSNYEILTKQ